MIEVKDLIPKYSEELIQNRIRELGEQISKDYKNEDLICVCVLKGAVFFFTDLVRNIDNKNLMIDFLRASSYGSGISSSTVVKILKDTELDVSGKHVLFVEDVIDSGITMHHIMQMFKDRNAKSVKLCALIDKKERREVDIKIDYAGFVLDKGFIVGYGLDLADRYRQLTAIYEAVVEEH